MHEVRECFAASRTRRPPRRPSKRLLAHWRHWHGTYTIRSCLHMSMFVFAYESVCSCLRKSQYVRVCAWVRCLCLRIILFFHPLLYSLCIFLSPVDWRVCFSFFCCQWNADGTLSIIDRKKNLVKLSHGECKRWAHVISFARAHAHSRKHLHTHMLSSTTFTLTHARTHAHSHTSTYTRTKVVIFFFF